MNRSLLAYFGHHRCGSNWIVNVVKEAGYLLGLKLSKGLHRPQLFNFDLPSYVKKHDIDFLCYINADHTFVRKLVDFRGFHVVRDPRDIVISSYFSHLHSHPTDGWPELIEHRKQLQSVSKEEGIFLEMGFRSWEFEHLRAWNYTLPNVLEIKMEELSNKPAGEYLRIFRFLGLVADGQDQDELSPLLDAFVMNLNKLHFLSHGVIPLRLERRGLSVAQLRRSVERYSFSNLAGGRRKGEADVKSHYRKGQAGDWRNHFTDEHVQRFKERYHGLLLKMGYESDLDWEL